jgi:two-component system chemotaxis response regulator CheB
MIKVLIVDDSILIQKVLSDIFAAAPGIEVVGTAEDPFVARDKIKQLQPDVVTLDIEMPKMDGITFLKKIMRLRPMPVVMISTLTQKGAPATLEALEVGAVEYVGKPSADSPELLAEYAGEIIEKVKMAAIANLGRLEIQASRHPLQRAPAPNKIGQMSNTIIAIGASTGGTEALRELLLMMPADSPPIVITQHIPPVFSASFAKRLDGMLPLTVHEAEDGDKIMAGHVYIAPGDRHLKINKKGGHYYCHVFDAERVNLHKPSVEVLFDSVTEHCAKNTIGIMLTGMGNDGAQAMLRMKQAGSYNIIQDKNSSVVWGMPGAAHELGAGDTTLPLGNIAGHVITALKRK